MFFRVVRGAAVSLAILWPAGSPGDPILRFFTDGCAAIQDEQGLVQLCERGPRAGSSCTQMPEFDPGSPRFSTDCCASLVDPDCNTNNPDTFCSDPTPAGRCSEGTFGRPCVANEGCDTGICIRGDDFRIGDDCTLDVECGVGEDPNTWHPVEGVCGSAQDGICAAPGSPTERPIGRVLRVNGDVALVAVVTSIQETPQPSFRKRERREPLVDVRVKELSKLEFIDPLLCSFAAQIGPLNVP